MNNTMDEFDLLSVHIQHFVGLLVVLYLGLSGICAFIAQFLPNPEVEVVTSEGKKEKCIHSNYFYYYFYKIINLLGSNLGFARNIANEEGADNKFLHMISLVARLATLGIFGKKMKNYCEEVQALDKEYGPTIEKDYQSISKVAESIDKTIEQVQPPSSTKETSPPPSCPHCEKTEKK